MRNRTLYCQACLLVHTLMTVLLFLMKILLRTGSSVKTNMCCTGRILLVICKSCGSDGSSSNHHHHHHHIFLMLSSLISQGITSLVFSFQPHVGTNPAFCLPPGNLHYITHSSSCVCIISTHGVIFFLHSRIFDSICVSCEIFASFCVIICTLISLLAQ